MSKWQDRNIFNTVRRERHKYKQCKRRKVESKQFNNSQKNLKKEVYKWTIN